LVPRVWSACHNLPGFHREVSENLAKWDKSLPQSAAKLMSRVGMTARHRTRRTKPMKKDRRWMKSIIAASTEAQVALPWARSTRRRPAALKDQAKPAPRAMAAR